MAAKGQEALSVVVRLRPWNEKEKEAGTVPVVHTDQATKTVSIVRRSDKKHTNTKYSGFKHVFTAFTSQQEVFESTAAPLVEDCLLGFAATIFAYGQTGTGKSFTMQGELHNPDKWGIMPRSAHLIFDSLANSERFESSRVTVSYLEIYNEELFDLLVPPDVPEASRVKLRVVEDKSPEGRGIYCNGLIEKPVTSAEDILEALSLAEERRAVEETKMNAQSSRSHCLFSITVTAREYCADGAGGMVMERTGRLNLVDLAGSESAKTAGAGNEQRGLERKNINQSLLALGRVITALQSLSASKLTGVDLAGRVPYRDSKLTRLLQDALGGRSKTTIVATCSPSELAVEETVSTLGYAQRASGITNRPAQNQLMSGSGRSLSPGPGAPGSGGGASSQDWRDLETRLQYMDNQVREAQYELARQHELQKEASARAAAAEDLVEGLEDTIATEQAAVGRQAERVALLHRSLATKLVHVAELRHLLAARAATEAALQAHAEALVGAVRGSVGVAEALQGHLEAHAADGEARRAEGAGFAGRGAAAADALRTRLATYLGGNQAARAAFATELAASCEATGRALHGLTSGLGALKARVAADATALAQNAHAQVSNDAATAARVLQGAAAGSDEVAAAVGAEATKIDASLEALFAETASAEGRLMEWAEGTAAAATSHADELRWRAEQEAALVAESAGAMEARHEAALDAAADDTAAIETLLGGLAEHATAADAHAASASAASAAAAHALEAARQRFEAAAADLAHATTAHRAAKTDAELVAHLAAAAAAISAAATRQTAALAAQAAEVDAARGAVLALVKEQKAAQATLVETVVAAVRQSLAAQSSEVCAKLDAAAAAVASKHSALAASNAALATDAAETFHHLATSGDQAAATAEAWQAAEETSAAVLARTAGALATAQGKASADAAAVAELHAAAAAEASDLASRTAAEEGAVAALRDSAVAATRAGEVAKAATAAAMAARADAVAEWKAADVAAAAETLASVEALQTELRAAFLPNLRARVTAARQAATETLMATLRTQLEAAQADATTASEARRAQWAAFEAATAAALVGLKGGLAAGVAEDCDRMLAGAAAAADAEASAAAARVERVASLGDEASSLDGDVARMVAASRADLDAFAAQVLRIDTPVPLPPPLPPTTFSAQVATTRPHRELLHALHGGDDGKTMDAAMLQRVSTLLDLHTQALDAGHFPFRDPHELETCESDLSSGAGSGFSPRQKNAELGLSPDSADEDENGDENGSQNPLIYN